MDGGGPTSLRVRLRMIAHQSSCVRARISSNPASGASNHSGLLNTPSILPPTSSTRSSSVFSASTATQHHQQQFTYEKNKYSISQQNLEIQRVNQTVCMYNTGNEMYQSTQNLPQSSLVRVNRSGETMYKNVKSFHLTENLQSNIRFDVTLKPSMSIRDNRLDPSMSDLTSAGVGDVNNKQNVSTVSTDMDVNTMSSMAAPNYSRSTSYENQSYSMHIPIVKSNKSRDSHQFETSQMVDEDDEQEEVEHQIDLPIDTCSRMTREQRVTQLPYRTNIPLNSSITFKIRNLNLFGGGNVKSPQPQQTQSVADEESEHDEKYSSPSNPFKFIETYSARRSPTNYKKARPLILFDKLNTQLTLIFIFSIFY